VLLGHTIAMLGPALAALYLWRVRHAESPAWSWSRPQYYAIVALAMLAFWTLPGLIGLLSGGTLRSPIVTHMWIGIIILLLLGWVSGMGEETGWCAYLLPNLSSQNGKTRAMIISGVIRGLWHWPVLVAPVLAQVVGGERTILELLGAGVVIAVQLSLGWIWYRTESIPLVGWTHFWHNLTRDVTIMLLAGYIDSLWVTQISAIVFYTFGAILLDTVRQKEGLEWKQIFRRANKQVVKKTADVDD
jgi:membrane protease YdiL (CAAX protease family)